MKSTPEKFYCKKDYYMENTNTRIFHKGRYYDVYEETSLSSVFPESFNSENFQTVWVVYNQFGDVNTTGYRFWINPSQEILYDPEIKLDKFSNYFSDKKEVRKLKLKQLYIQ